MADVGELLVGAYLREVEACDVVSYNVRPRGGKREGLSELDVIGLRFSDRSAHLCEVATHLHGLGHGKGYDEDIKRVKKKLECQRRHARTELTLFDKPRFMFWSPRVPRGLLDGLRRIEGLELVINSDFSARVRALQKLASKSAAETGNTFFRTLQLLERLRD